MTAPQSAASAPLDQPLYGASFGDAIRRFFKKYADFTGRASRSEFWWWYLFAVLIAIVYSILLTTLGTIGNGGRGYGPIGWILIVVYIVWVVAIVVPSLALVWRRLHDANYPGPFFFLGLIPLVGWIILLVFYLMPSKPEGARFDRR
ncbi:DUF805 domain-containing protein [Leifsonia shinshuensis]|uniref:DUF805 domain-containing protein n=1 Tax=Leifsonia shinshuensis TaxID=150026 RepID=A0A7G6YEN0_9MICO|nr:DUF805 domain-containing protein [Leifsonia shinshuensis]QNE36945.1 DUF805 domain-containing protein [Leifsonia shinshuensis]